jgi:hypothetical protein
VFPYLVVRGGERRGGEGLVLAGGGGEEGSGGKGRGGVCSKQGRSLRGRSGDGGLGGAVGDAKLYILTQRVSFLGGGIRIEGGICSYYNPIESVGSTSLHSDVNYEL